MGWPEVRLADCCQIKPPKSEARKILLEDDLVSFVPMNNLGINTPVITLDEDKPLSKVSGSYTYFADNDVLLAKITPCFENGKLGIAKGLTNSIGFGSSEFIVFRTGESLLPEFLYYYLLQPSFREAGQAVMTGAVGHKRVPKDYIEDTRIPLASIPEQKRIVAILDQAFADIDKARALTEQNLKNARELFESYLQQMFSQRGEGWKQVRLNEICSFSSGGTPSKKKGEFWGGDIPWISGRDMKYTKLSRSTLSVTKQAISDTSVKVAKSGTILVLVRGMGLAHGAQIGELTVPAAYNQDIRGLHPSNGFNSRFLVFALRIAMNRGENIFSNAAHGTLKINFDVLKTLILNIPSEFQQNEIVYLVDEIILQCRNLEDLYSQKLAHLDELKKSLLQKAFSGELTKESEAAA